MTTDNNTGISAEELREKISGSEVSGAIMAAMLKEEIEKNGIIQTCGMAPAGYFGVYGPGNSITEKQLMDGLGEAAVLPNMAKHFVGAVGAPEVQHTTNFDLLIKPTRSA